MIYKVLAEKNGRNFDLRIKSENSKKARLLIKKMGFDVLGIHPFQEEFPIFTPERFG